MENYSEASKQRIRDLNTRMRDMVREVVDVLMVEENISQAEAEASIDFDLEATRTVLRKRKSAYNALSVLYMDKEKKFVFEERRSATIPISHQERYSWIQVFELLSDFEQLLKNQDDIEGLLREENTGSMMLEQETVRNIFEGNQYYIDDQSQA